MLKNLFEGISTYGAAIKHINQYGLWRFVLFPGLLSVLLGISIFMLAWGLSDNIGAILDNLWIWDWGKNVVAQLTQVLGGILVLLIGMLVFKQLVMVVSSPIMSVLSEKVENQLVGRKTGVNYSMQNIVSDLLRGLKIAIRNIIREIGATLLLLLLSLIPIFAPFTIVLIFIVQAYYAGFGNLDFTLERHYRYRESIKFVQKNRLLAIGNGTVFMFLLYTLIGLLIALPLSTVAATIAATKRINDFH
ncbi:MAG: coproporphyrinogen III oxidase [Bacteroidetes bacterium]|nr:coproporphyrinogen III oxidase [Bacteroidota bacterium]